MLKDKVAVVTGAGRGIGRAIVEAFARQGAHIVAAARTPEELAETVALAGSHSAQAIGVECDVADPAAVDRLARATADTFGAADILINNAGFAHFMPFEQLGLEEWRRTLDVNLTGPFLVTQAFLSGMIARRSGRIINISSVAGHKGIEHQSAYCASKHGLNGLTKVLAMELRQHNISVHAICPGGVDTRLAHEAMPGRDKSNWMQPEDIAATAIYLCSLSPQTAIDFITPRRFDSVPL